MSYESKIYVCHKASYKDEISNPGKYWAQVVAIIDVSSFTNVSNILRDKPATDCFFYADDGSTMITTDEYNQPLTECSVDELLEILQAEVDNGQDYRRLAPLYAMIKVFAEDNEPKWNNRLTILHYGY